MPKNPTLTPKGPLPTKLKTRRLLLGLSQKAVAEASQGRLTREVVARTETGEGWPDPRQLQALADVYACSRGTVCEESMDAWLGRRKAPSHD